LRESKSGSFSGRSIPRRDPFFTGEKGRRPKIQSRCYLLAVITNKTCNKVIEATELFSLFSLFGRIWKAHCFHYFLTDSPTKHLENGENSELPDSSKQ
jgi:hypothetical protein